MKYADLLDVLGTPRKRRHATMFPDNPWHRIAELSGKSVEHRGDKIIVWVPLDDCTVLVFGRVVPGADGIQMLTHCGVVWCPTRRVTADNVVQDLTEAELQELTDCWYDKWERAEFGGD